MTKDARIRRKGQGLGKITTTIRQEHREWLERRAAEEGISIALLLERIIEEARRRPEAQAAVPA